MLGKFRGVKIHDLVRVLSLNFIVVLLVVLMGCTSGTRLTREQRVEDFEYLFKTMQDSYPFFGVQQRLFGVSWLDNYDSYLKRVRGAWTDKKFARVLGEVLGELKQGHTGLLTSEAYHYLASLQNEAHLGQLYDAMRLDGAYPEHSREDFVEQFRPWIDSLSGEKTRERYGYTPHLSIDLEPSYRPSGLLMSVLEEGEIAYLAVRSFAGDIAADQPIIRSFYEDIADYPYFIVDIRGNGGGNDLYWMQNIIAPLISEVLQANMWNVWKDSDIARRYIQSMDSAHSISGLADLPNLPPEVRNEFAYYSPHQRAIKPVDYTGFMGEIYLLVDSRVYSSAEAFAATASESGWATLVGTRTGGDGIGMTPVTFALPNSGLVVRIPLIMGLNPDGSANAEMGTSPDIWVNSNEDALSVALELIRGR